MRYIGILAGIGLLLAVTGTAGATTYIFDPDDLIQAYPGSAGDETDLSTYKVVQDNARRAHEVWGSYSPNKMYDTFWNPYTGDPNVQPDEYNTYMNWRDGLGAGEGISAFNIWLQDNPRARSWGEQVVWNPLGAPPTGTADADGKWSVSVDPNPWGTGWLVQWSTDDPADYINTISDIGDFSFSGTAYWDNNENDYDASDPEVQLGEYVRIWFGAGNWTESDGEEGWDQEWSVHFDDQGWGSRTSTYGVFPVGFVDSEGYGSGYEGVLNIQAVPEPATMALMALGGIGMLVSRKRSK